MILLSAYPRTAGGRICCIALYFCNLFQESIDINWFYADNGLVAMQQNNVRN